MYVYALSLLPINPSLLVYERPLFSTTACFYLLVRNVYFLSLPEHFFHPTHHINIGPEIFQRLARQPHFHDWKRNNAQSVAPILSIVIWTMTMEEIHSA
jgi:hypothetical protein